MNKWLKFFPFIFLPILACSTYYETSFKHFNRANAAYKNLQLGRTLKEYDRALETFKDAQLQPIDHLLLSAIYHQLYLINPLVFWEKLDKTIHAQCPYISKIISDHSLTKPSDFLTLSFQSILNSEEMLKNTPLPKQEEWLLIEKNIIVGDFLMREANAEIEPSLTEKIHGVVSDEFIKKIQRHSFYELALVFYLEAWVKTINFIYRYPTLNMQWLTELSRERLKGICWSLVSITTTLSYYNKNTEFQDIFRQKSHRYLEVIKQIDITNLPLPSDMISSEEKISSLIGLKQEKNYLILNASYHFNEARVKISTALEEILAKKNTVFPYFLDALKSIFLARTLANFTSFSHPQLIYFVIEDVYLTLFRLSE